jgi:type IV fimbrial biogenesis protein FimT
VLKAMRARGAAPGFTLIEMMIAITITSILLVVGVPAMRGVVENTRIRAVSESLKYGLDLARNDAVRLNTQVEFVSSPTGWEVRRVSDASVLHQGNGKESPAEVTLTITPDDADRVTFDAFGRNIALNPSDGSAPLTQIDIESTNPPTVGGYRPMRVQVLGGGVTRLCDPAVDATDPRVCL